MDKQVQAGLTRPASVGQRLLWMMDHYGGDPGALNVPVIYRLRGELDKDALRRGLADLASRHESLRTTFAWDRRRLNQRISPSAEIPFEEVDATSMPVDALNEEIHRTQREPLDVSRSALRLTLFRRRDEDHFLLLNIHHLVTDAWSNRLLSRDLAAFYSSHRNGIPAQLPEITWQFRRFQDWQDEHLNQQRMGGHFEFWKTHLAGARFPRLPRVELVTSQRTSGIARFDVSSEVLAHLRHIARSHRTTLYTVMLSGFFCALFELTGQENLCLGSLFANRVRPEIQDTVGFFVNMLAISQRMAKEDSFGDVLDRMRVTVAQALEHQEVPYQLLPRTALPDPGGSAQDVVFHMLAVPPGASEACWEGLEAESLHLLALLNSRFDLEIVIVPTADRLAGVVRYASNVYDAALVARLVGSYQKFLTGAESTAARTAAP